MSGMNRRINSATSKQERDARYSAAMQRNKRIVSIMDRYSSNVAKANRTAFNDYAAMRSGNAFVDAINGVKNPSQNQYSRSVYMGLRTANGAGN